MWDNSAANVHPFHPISRAWGRSANDIVAGYRARRQDPPHRLLFAWGWNILVRLVLGIRIRDIDCAFKVFNRDVFDRAQIQSVGAMVNTEIFAQVSRFGMTVMELA
jgi:hypothetical protein